MKRIKYITITLLSCLLYTSCEIGFLDNQAYSDLTRENSYNSIADYESALVGCYYYISGRGPLKEGIYTVGMPVLGEAGTDEAWINPNKGANFESSTQLDLYFTLNPDNTICQEVWKYSYAGINATNEIIIRIREMSPEQLEAAPRFQEIAAEASFLQALWYFNLVRIYGGVPIRTDPSRNSTDYNVPRNSIEEVYAHIFSLLDYAKNYLPEKAVQYGRSKRASAYALSAKAALQVASSMQLLEPRIPEAVKLGGVNSFEWQHIDESGQQYTNEETIRYYYERARDDAQTALDMFAPNYLMPTFTDCFYPHESSDEILFEAVLSYGLSTESGGWFGSLFGPKGPSAQGGGQQVVLPIQPIVMDNFTYDMTNATPCTSRDDRFAWSISTFEIKSGQGEVPIKFNQRYKQFQIGKFRIDAPPAYNQDRTPVNNPILRVSEVCLIHSEAQAELDEMDGKGITNDALKFLNIVRERAKLEAYTAASIVKVIPLEKTAQYGNKKMIGYKAVTPIEHFRRAILNERMMELLGEGHRWFDLVRMGLLTDVAAKAVEYARTRNTEDANPVLVNPNIPSRRIEDFNIFRPIPAREISLHKRTLIQNYGYL